MGPDDIGRKLREHRVPSVDAGEASSRGVRDSLILRLWVRKQVADDVEDERDGDEDLEDEAVVGEARLVVNDPWQSRTAKVSESEGGSEQPRYLWLVNTQFRGFLLVDRASRGLSLVDTHHCLDLHGLPEAHRCLLSTAEACNQHSRAAKS